MTSEGTSHRVPKFNCYPIGNSFAVVSPDSKDILMLSSVAGRILEAQQQGGDKATIARRLVEEYQIDHGRAELDVSNFSDKWNEWVEHISNSSPGPPPDCDSVPETKKLHRFDLVRTYAFLGSSFRVSYGSRRLLDRLHPKLGFLERCNPDKDSADVIQYFVAGSGRKLFLTRNGSILQEAQPLDVIAESLFMDLARTFYPTKEWLAYFHAAAVSDGKSCILLPAEKGKGKSTLTAGFLSNNYLILGDDLVPMSRERLLYPLPLALRIKEGSWHIVRALLPEAKKLLLRDDATENVHLLRIPECSYRGAVSGVPAKCLVFPEYRASASLSLSQISAEETLTKLISSGVRFMRSHPEAKLWFSWLDTINCFELVYSDIEEATSVLSEFFFKKM